MNPDNTPATGSQATLLASALELVVITGMSGSGKSVALRALEDASYHCVDNLPPELLASFVALEQQHRKNRIAIVIDVREQGEYAQGHIPNARHIPAGEMERRSKEMEKWKDHPVILCCATGARSNSAANTLKKAGFAKIYNLRGGMMEWQKAGQPVSRKRK